MCGIAGAFDLRGEREFSRRRLLGMTGALAHRGPDDEQIHVEPGVAMGVRRLSVIDVAGGRQPLCNEDGKIWVAYEWELFNYSDLKPGLLERGHTLKTSCDTEAWVHLYEDYGLNVFDYARGQFAVALWDSKLRTLVLGRDRSGIAPLFYAEADGWLLWGSEIKALLASGLVDPTPDLKGIDYFFNFFSVNTERTCFQNVKSVAPGSFLRIRKDAIQLRQYWDLDFPDAGDERTFSHPAKAAEEFESIVRSAVRRRLTGEMPICCYISGGLDSTTILGIASQENGGPVPALTASLEGAGPNCELDRATESASLIGSPLTTVRMAPRDIAATFPEAVQAAESPLLDTSATCMIRLAHAARRQGFTVTLTGEGADENLAGYFWFKTDLIGRWTTKPANLVFRELLFSSMGGHRHRPHWGALSGVRVAQQYSWETMAQSRELLYTAAMWDRLGAYSAYDEVPLKPDRIRRWHPLNRSLYAAHKVLLAGMLLAAKGDRTLRNGSTEGRFPYLDEDVVDFSRQLPPSYKLRGWTDKWLLRQVARRALPAQIADRPKTMFRANLSWNFLGPDRPAWVDQLLSPESLCATGYFDPTGIGYAREAQHRLGRRSFKRFVLDMGLTAVISTQLWHHLYCGGGLADLPTWTPRRRAVTDELAAVSLLESHESKA